MLGQLIVRTADLLEAEGRLAKQGIFRLASALAIAIAAAVVMVVAVLLLGAAVFLALLAAGLPPSMVALIMGLVLAVVSGTGVLVARSMGMSKR